MSKIAYPGKRLLLVRDCTVDICFQANPAAVALSALLFWYEHPWAGDVEDEGAGLFILRRTQEQIVEGACHQIEVKTLHDVAVPILCLLGYLSVTERIGGNVYILHIARIKGAYAAYAQGPAALQTYAKQALQLEKFLIDMPAAQLELLLINKKFLYLQLEKVLFAISKSSNCKRGPKGGRKAAAAGQKEAQERLREITRESPSASTEQREPLAAATPPGEQESSSSQRQTAAGVAPESPGRDQGEGTAGKPGDQGKDDRPTGQYPAVRRGTPGPNPPTRPPGSPALSLPARPSRAERAQQQAQQGQSTQRTSHTQEPDSVAPAKETPGEPENKKNTEGISAKLQNWRAKRLRLLNLSERAMSRLCVQERRIQARTGGPPRQERAYYAEVNALINLLATFTDREIELMEGVALTRDIRYSDKDEEVAAVKATKLGAAALWNASPNYKKVLEDAGKWPGGQTPTKPGRSVPTFYDPQSAYTPITL